MQNSELFLEVKSSLRWAVCHRNFEKHLFKEKAFYCLNEWFVSNIHVTGDITFSTRSSKRFWNKHLARALTKHEQRTKETLINNFFVKQRAFYRLIEWSGSNIAGDIIFFDEDRTLDSDNKHFVNNLPTRAETQIFPCKNIKFTC